MRELQRRQEQIFQQQEDLRRRQEEEFRKGQERAPSREGPALLAPEKTKPGAPCAQVRRIVVTGVTLFSTKNVQKLAAPYENKCLSLEEINNLLRDISNHYIERGYVTTRAFVDPTQEREGVLRVLVVEGKVEKIILNQGDPDSYYRGRMAFPRLEGKPLNLRDIEQGLDQLNRLSSSNATMELVPGTELGGTVVQVTDTPRRTWRAGLGMDNLGQRSTGQSQYSLSLEKDNFMGLGDQWAVYWNQSAPFVDAALRSHKEVGHNHSFSAFTSLPWGYWTFSANFSRFAYDTRIYGMNTSYLSSGETQVESLQAERVLHRDADSKTTLGFSLTFRDVDTFIERVRLITSSYFLTTGAVSLSHNRRMLGGVAGLKVEYVRGLPLFGNKRIADTGHLVPKSEFDKFATTLTWYRPFEWKGQRFYWNLMVQGQFSPQTLYGAERIQIGGRSSVRGFQESSISGDQGAFVRNEIGWNAPWFESWRDKGPITGWQLFAAYDYGFIAKDRKDPYERGTMQGVTLGLRTLGDVSLEAALSKPLDYPRFTKARDTEFYVSFKYTF